MSDALVFLGYWGALVLGAAMGFGWIAWRMGLERAERERDQS